MKKKLFFMIIGILLGVTIGVGASTLINSNQVGYTPSDSNWDVKSVDAAITSLYDKINYGNATAADIKSGKTALVGGKEITGSLSVMDNAQKVKFGKVTSIVDQTSPLYNFIIVDCGFEPTSFATWWNDKKFIFSYEHNIAYWASTGIYSKSARVITRSYKQQIPGCVSINADGCTEYIKYFTVDDSESIVYRITSTGFDLLVKKNMMPNSSEAKYLCIKE